MLRKPLLSMLAVLALAGGVFACGEDDTPAGDPAVEEQTTDSATEEATPATPEEGSTPAAPAQDVEAAIEACKESARSQPNISDEAKADIEKVCEEAADGDPEKVKEATRKVCERIVEEQVPEGAARDQALQTCATATE